MRCRFSWVRRRATRLKRRYRQGHVAAACFEGCLRNPGCKVHCTAWFCVCGLGCWCAQVVLWVVLLSFVCGLTVLRCVMVFWHNACGSMLDVLVQGDCLI